MRRNNSSSFADTFKSMEVVPTNLPTPLSSKAVQLLLASLPRDDDDDDDDNNKRRPKRRLRKPQKPGKTAKNQERQFVVHNYHDHASDSDATEDSTAPPPNKNHFPRKLHLILDQVAAKGWSHIISWSIHGRCFLIHQPQLFTDWVLPHYFRQSKLTSFQRQLNLYGFQRITRGPDAGGYYHEYFLRGKPALSDHHMTRVRVKGTRYKAASNPAAEPNFYAMPFVVATTTVASYGEDSNSYLPIPVPSLSSSRRMVTGYVSPSPSMTEQQYIGLPRPEESMSLSTALTHQGDVVPVVPYGGGDLLPPSAVSAYDDGDDDNVVEDEVIAEFCADWVASDDEMSVSNTTTDDDIDSMIEKLLED